MAEAPRSNRPAPRTAAAVEAELRRRIRTELTQARSEAENGVLDDAALAAIIARAVSAALTWHLEAPEHTRNATLSSRTWRPAGGPRGGRPQEFEERTFEERGPRSFEERGPRPFRDRGPRDFDRDRFPPREREGFDRDRFPPRDDAESSGGPPRGPRQGGPRQAGPPRWRQGPGPRGGGGRPPSRGGGFGPRRPRSR